MKALLSGLLLAASTSATAQPAPAPATPSIAAAPASSTGLAIARQLVGMLNLDATYDRMFVPLMPVFSQAVIGMLQGDATTRDAMQILLDKGEGGQAKFVEILSQEFFASLRARYPALKESAAAEYARVFSDAELRELVAFYSSGTGAKTLKVQPELQSRLSAAGQELGRKAGEEAARRAFERAEREMLPQKKQSKS